MNKLRLFSDWWRTRKYLVFYLSLIFFLSIYIRGHGSYSRGELGDGQPGWPAVVRGLTVAQGDMGRGRVHSADGRRPLLPAHGSTRPEELGAGA